MANKKAVKASKGPKINITLAENREGKKKLPAKRKESYAAYILQGA